MKTKILILSITVVAIFLIGCPNPQIGLAPTRDITGGEGTPAAPVAGSISVVNDEARGQAVYINENGVRFDVVAEEYAGGPLARCVEVADFTLVPPSSDSDALPVKAVVVGTRDDGTPGVWQINSDDTISLPEPEVTTDDTARCIIGGDMATLPGSVQLRYGWKFAVDAVSADGKMIVGHAHLPTGVVIGGYSIPSDSDVGVYWRAYNPAFTRFVVVSPPRIIGTFVKTPLPTGWTPDARHFTAILAALKQFFVGTLEAYIRLPQYHVPPLSTGNPGEYLVKGFDDLGYFATAVIDKTGGVVVTEVPDLTVSVSVNAVEGSVDQWKLDTTVMNKTAGPSKSFTVSYTLDGAATGLLPAFTKTDGLAGGAQAQLASQTFSFSTVGDHTIVATVAAASNDYEYETTDNSGSAGFTVAPPSGGGNTYSRIIIDTYEPDVGLTGGFGSGVDALALYKVVVDASGNPNLVEIASDLNPYNDPAYVPANPDSADAGYRFAYIDYRGTPLASGTYWIKIAASYPQDPIPPELNAYAIRVLTAPDPNVAQGLQRDASWFFTGPYSDAYESDDSPGSPPAVPMFTPTSTGTLASIELGTGAQALVRTLSSNSDVDWVKLVLP